MRHYDVCSLHEIKIYIRNAAKFLKISLDILNNFVDNVDTVSLE